MDRRRRAGLFSLTVAGLACSGATFTPPVSPRQIASFTDGSNGFYYNPPTVANGRVYIGTSHKLHRAPSGANRFYALDATTLAQVWEHDLGANEVRGAATVDSAGNVYFVVEAGRLPSDETHEYTGPLRLCSLSPEGGWRWDAEVDSVGSTLGMSNPAVAADDTVYVGGGDGLYAFDPSGVVTWHHAAGRVMNAPVIDPAGNIYFVTSSSGTKAVSVRPDSTARWETAVGSGNGVSSPAFSVDHSSVFVASGDTVYKLSAETGAIVWQLTPPGEWGEFRATPAVDDQDNVYVGTKNDRSSVFYAIGEDDFGAPQVLWSRAIGADLYSSPALGNDRTLYVGSEFTPGAVRLHALDMATGATRWSAPIASGDVTWSSPALTGDGTLYVATMALDERGGGTVLAFDTESASLLGGAGSPRFHGGNASTGRRE